MAPGATLDLDTRVARTDEIVSAVIDDETVMMSIEQGEYYGLNAVGSRIWELLEKPGTGMALCQVLLEEFDVSEEECRQDVVEILEELLGKRLIRIC